MYWFILLRPIDCLMRSMYVHGISFYFTTSYHYYYHLEQLFTMWAFKHILEFQISFDKIALWLACLFSASFCFRFHFMANITVLFSFFATIWYIIFWSLWTFVIVFFHFLLLFSSCVPNHWMIDSIARYKYLRFKSIQINRKEEHIFGSSLRLSMRLCSENGNRSSITRNYGIVHNN